MNDAAQERRTQNFGRRWTDKPSSQFEEHFSGIIDVKNEELKRDLVAAFKEVLQDSIRDLSVRVERLEHREGWILAFSVISSLAAVACFMFWGKLMGWWL